MYTLDTDIGRCYNWQTLWSQLLIWDSWYKLIVFLCTINRLTAMEERGEVSGTNFSHFHWLSYLQAVPADDVGRSVNFDRHFWFSLLYIETEMLTSLSHILVIGVFHSFIIVLHMHFIWLLLDCWTKTYSQSNPWKSNYYFWIYTPHIHLGCFEGE